MSRGDVEKAVCAAWNGQWPPGTAVLLVDDEGEVCSTSTRSTAWVNGGGIGVPVVKIVGRPGCYALERIIPHRDIEPEAPHA